MKENTGPTKTLPYGLGPCNNRARPHGCPSVGSRESIEFAARKNIPITP